MKYTKQRVNVNGKCAQIINIVYAFNWDCHIAGFGQFVSIAIYKYANTAIMFTVCGFWGVGNGIDLGEIWNAF